MNNKILLGILSCVGLISLNTFASIEATTAKMSASETSEYIADSLAFELPIKISEKSIVKGMQSKGDAIILTTIFHNSISSEIESLSLVKKEVLNAINGVCENKTFSSFIKNKKGQVILKFRHDNGVPSLEHTLDKCN